MPVYAFECGACGEDFVLLRSIAERSAPAPCPQCQQEARRLISAPHLAVMSSHGRRASAINERSQHEPRVSSPGNPGFDPPAKKSRHSCGSGCGGGTAVRQSRTAKTGLGTFKTPKAGARPWMLGH